MATRTCTRTTHHSRQHSKRIGDRKQQTGKARCDRLRVRLHAGRREGVEGERGGEQHRGARGADGARGQPREQRDKEDGQHETCAEETFGNEPVSKCR